MVTPEGGGGATYCAQAADFKCRCWLRMLAACWRRVGRVGSQAVERVKGIEPSYEAWEAAVLPLNYTRKGRQFTRRPHELPPALAGCGVREESAGLGQCGEARVLAFGRPNSGPGGGTAVTGQERCSRHPSKRPLASFEYSTPPSPLQAGAPAWLTPGLLCSPLHHQGLRPANNRGARRSGLLRGPRSGPGKAHAGAPAWRGLGGAARSRNARAWSEGSPKFSVFIAPVEISQCKTTHFL